MSKCVGGKCWLGARCGRACICALFSGFCLNLVRRFSAPCSFFFNLSICVADGVSECSTTLDDSVSEEEEGSFDELTDVTPYLQPGVELSVLNEVRLRRETCHDVTLANICSQTVY